MAKRETGEFSGVNEVLLDESRDGNLWLDAVRDVQPIADRSERPRRKPKTTNSISAIDEDVLETMQELQDIVDGKLPLDFVDSDEFVEGRAGDCPRLNLMKLRNGEYAVQAELDLHGLNRERAKDAVQRFFEDSQRRGLRCVLVIPGRGHGSPGGKSILKELFVRWMSVGFLKHSILAFSSARVYHGGVGAIYVLLRKG